MSRQLVAFLPVNVPQRRRGVIQTIIWAVLIFFLALLMLEVAVGYFLYRGIKYAVQYGIQLYRTHHASKA